MKENKKIFFYCQSYQAFNLALANSLKKEVTVISSAKNIIKACKYLNVNYLSHKNFSIKEIIKNKKNVDNEACRLIEAIGENELHFTHTQFAVFCFYLVKKLNDNGRKTVFHNFEFVYSQPLFYSKFNRNYLKEKVFQILIKNRYRLPIEIRMSTSSSFMISLKLDYIKSCCYKYINDESIYFQVTLDLFKNNKFDFAPIDNLFIAQTFNNEAFFNSEKIKKILPVLNSVNVVVKNHPKLGNIKGLKDCNILPDFLPVELFFNKVKKSVISFHSTSLITASKFNHFKTISLIDIVKTNDSFMEKVKQDLINKSKNRIFFPQSINEFKHMLYD